MLHTVATITSPDFPEIIVTLRKPKDNGGGGARPGYEWNEYQDDLIRGNAEEAKLNLTISCATVTTNDGSPPPTVAALADEWSNLTDLALGSLAEMAGVWGTEFNATALDLPGMLAAAQRVSAWQEKPVVDRAFDNMPTVVDEDLAKLAARCATFGLDATTMGVIVAERKRRPNSYRAFIIDDVCCLVITRPGTSVRSAFDRGVAAKEYATACWRLVAACAIHPAPGELAAIAGRLPAFVTTAAAEIQSMRDVPAEVKKGLPDSAKPAPISS